MKKTALSALTTAAAICFTLTGCGTNLSALATGKVPSGVIYSDNTSAAQTELSEASKTSKAHEASETPETSKSPKTSGASETSKEHETPGTSETSRSHKTLGTPETSRTTEASKKHEASEPPEASKKPEASGTTEPPGTSKSPKSSETPETTEGAASGRLIHGGHGGRGGDKNAYGNFDDAGNAGQFRGKNASSSNAISSDTTINVTMGSSALDTSDLFSKRDLSQTADLTGSQTITVADNKTITITEEGVYVIKGSAKNCTITVNADKSAKVQLVLDSISITNDDFPAIYVVSADKCFVTTTNSDNTLAVTGEFKADGETKTDAVIFSKDDLVLNGVGTLNITSAHANGISGKDDIKITGGTYHLTTAEDGIEANDSISICGGKFTINSKKDALHSENDDGGSVGWIYISGGEFDITASSDGIQATTILQIDGGTFNIKSFEGFEASYVQINGGEVTISASDDGINATRKSTAITTPTVEINDGAITITMGQGDTDGIDANGNIYVNGGKVNVTGQSTFDYDGVGQLNGGTVIVNGQQVNSLPQSMQGGRFGGR